MSSAMRSRFAIVLFFVAALVAQVAWASSVIVHRNVNLRRDASTSQPPIELLKPPTTLTLLDPSRTHGYYHVALENGTEGWVWSRNVRVVESNPPGTSGIAEKIDPSWNKPAPVSSSYSAEGKVCGPAGGPRGDTATNLRKNRTDVPAGYHDVSFAAIATLPYPIENKALGIKVPTSRMDWTNAELAVIAPYEGIPVKVIGYIAALKTEGAELTNCKMTHAADVDWHIALVANPGQGEDKSIVVETTPRVRQSHPGWTTTKIGHLLDCGRKSSHWADCKLPVRISGWLMLDPRHQSYVGQYRETIWEVHPITAIEVQQNGQWKTLDSIE